MKKAIEDAVRTLGGVWPSDEPAEVYLYRFSSGRYSAGLSGGTARYICTRYEFEQCTRRLRNEPSFDDHPDAKCFVQNDNGRWHKNTNTTNVAPYNAGNWRSQDDGYGWLFVQTGEVIGDWKQTLRLRPEEKKVGIKCGGENCDAMDGFGHSDECIAQHEEAVATNVGNMHPEARIAGYKGQPAKQSYSPSEFAAWDEGRKARIIPTQDEGINDWHKKGEFPPVGTECEVLYDGTWERTRIIGLNGDAIVVTTDWDEIHSYDGVLAEPTDFRPLQTERERLIHMVLHAINEKSAGRVSAPVKLIVESLADAGMLKMPEDKQ